MAEFGLLVFFSSFGASQNAAALWLPRHSSVRACLDNRGAQVVNFGGPRIDPLFQTLAQPVPQISTSLVFFQSANLCEGVGCFWLPIP